MDDEELAKRVFMQCLVERGYLGPQEVPADVVNTTRRTAGYQCSVNATRQAFEEGHPARHFSCHGEVYECHQTETTWGGRGLLIFVSQPFEADGRPRAILGTKG